MNPQKCICKTVLFYCCLLCNLLLLQIHHMLCTQLKSWTWPWIYQHADVYLFFQYTIHIRECAICSYLIYICSIHIYLGMRIMQTKFMEMQKNNMHAPFNTCISYFYYSCECYRHDIANSVIRWDIYMHTYINALWCDAYE